MELLIVKAMVVTGLLVLMGAMVWGSSFYLYRSIAGDKKASRYAKRTKALLRKFASRSLGWMVLTLPWWIIKGSWLAVFHTLRFAGEGFVLIGRWLVR